MVFACALEHIRYFNVEADSKEQMLEWLRTHDASDVDDLTKNYRDEYDERICDVDEESGNVYEPHFSIATRYYPVYSKEHDMTFIIKENGNEISVCGFYFGEPNEYFTKEYAGKLMAKKNVWVEEHLKGVI